ncbi:Endonuclease/Exonuclease/phosphatase family protein [Thalassovita gelatinovora]|uniref:Endonuclease/Exonuclease/phosphatase family protein n=1 Tax=Thalassovita gelatinovora TaxID=53501 RepID=A0A0P1F4V4_THAGE|nr:endonuclease/exonuclease/phosphatase family protein [Thalassovita gelatinovora]QIZ79398.1 endonuclease [Thalassovita gelatinovora]CUH62726.1 Endonuclease/Exonuclease/phosphatase family protein [Thalassovita gelatinovora]SEQ09174.1 Metal-dependent hydrolase, endonuclease/exonuclease/phosphatase family [Thalassovita gelatinovora]
MTLPTCRIASYNLQKCVGLDLRRRPDRSLSVIAGLDAQVVVLQEADKRLPPRPAALPHEMIEDDGWTILPFGQPGGSIGWHGNAMLVRPGVKLRKTAHIELPGLEPRGAIRAELDTSIGPLRVVGAHLGLIRRYRLMQISAIIRHLRDLPDMPTVLAGDFNEWGSVRPLDTVAHGLRFIPTAPSFPAPRPVAALDRFALSDHLQAVRTKAHRGQPARIASDHLPIWADIAMA